jgi:hypothetical protein
MKGNDFMLWRAVVPFAVASYLADQPAFYQKCAELICGLVA